MKALIVEDEPDLCDFFQRVVTSEGFETRTAANGRVGLEVFDAFRPELVLCDIRMPVMDGLEMLSAMRERGSDSFVVMVTGHDNEEYVIEALRNGAGNYLRKPVALNDFRELLGKYADLIRARSARGEIPEGATGRQFTVQLGSRINLIARMAGHFVSECGEMFSERERMPINLGIYELLVNAVEHGNLGIAYEKKSVAMKAGTLDSLYRERVADPSLGARKVTVDFKLDAAGCEWVISDEGDGFDWQAMPKTLEEEGFTRPHGRGIVISQYVFDELEFIGKGNVVRARKNAPERAEESQEGSA